MFNNAKTSVFTEVSQISVLYDEESIVTPPSRPDIVIQIYKANP